MNKETIITAIVAVIVAVFDLLKVFGIVVPIEDNTVYTIVSLIVAAVMAITILGGSLNIISTVLLVIEGAALAMGGLAIGIYQLAMWKRRK